MFLCTKNIKKPLQQHKSLKPLGFRFRCLVGPPWVHASPRLCTTLREAFAGAAERGKCYVEGLAADLLGSLEFGVFFLKVLVNLLSSMLLFLCNFCHPRIPTLMIGWVNARGLGGGGRYLGIFRWLLVWTIHGLRCHDWFEWKPDETSATVSSKADHLQRVLWFFCISRLFDRHTRKPPTTFSWPCHFQCTFCRATGSATTFALPWWRPGFRWCLLFLGDCGSKPSKPTR